MWFDGVFSCLVMELMRGSGAEKNILEIVWRTRFLSVRGAAEDPNSVM